MKKCHDRSVIILLGLIIFGVTHQCCAQQAPSPDFTLDFSHGTSAVIGGELVPGNLEGTFISEDSPHGKAMLSGPNSGYLYFPAENAVNPQSGTVEMWVCPQDWNGTEQQFHVFFNARGQGMLYLYKYYQGGLLMLSAPTFNGPYFSTSANIDTWQPGQWHFIAGTWSSTRNAVYVDGTLVSTSSSPVLPDSLSDLEIGDDPWNEPNGPRNSQSLVAGVRIYDHALTAEHISAHYMGDYSKVVSVSSSLLSLNLDHNIVTHQLTASLDIGGADIDGTDTTATFSLEKDGVVIQTQSKPVNNYITQAVFATGSLGSGTYQVVTHVVEGTHTGDVAKQFVIPDQSWMGNTLGESTANGQPPYPFMPMNVTKWDSDLAVNVSCWGRTYIFDKAALPTQIISQQQSMLASPISLKVLSAGQQLVWNNGQINVVQSSPTSVTLQGTATAQISAGTVNLTTNIVFGYDGVITLSINMKKPANWQPETVSLEIPVNKANAIYYHRASYAWNNPCGFVPTGNGVVDHTSFQPFSWLGDDTRGLFWFCETGEFWPNYKDTNALQIVRNASSVSIVANLQKGQSLSNDWTFNCGLEATPVKSIPETDRRKWRLSPGIRANVNIIWPSPNAYSELYYGYPQAANDVNFASVVNQLHNTGEAALPYSSLTYLSSACPEYVWFKNSWDMGIHDSMSSDVASYNASFNAVSAYQQSLQDFLVWKNVQFFNQFHLDGFYYDNAYPRGSTVADADYGWQDGFTRQPTFGILAERELHRRVYTALKNQNYNTFVMEHMSGMMTIPMLGYDTAVLNGEQFRGLVKDSYMDVMSLDQWRAVYTGKQWGVIGYFIPEFDAEHSAEVAPTRGLAALVMLHDVNVWPIWSNINVWNDMYDALDAFDYADSTFIPYWSTNPPASTNMMDVYVSAYKRSDGRALLIVGNTARDPRSGTVTLNANSLGLPVINVYSWPDGKSLVVNNGTVSVSLDGLDYQMLLVGTPPA